MGVQRHLVRRPAAALIAITSCLALGLSACSDAEGSDNTTTASKVSEDVYAPTFTEPPSEPNPAAEGKTVWVISVGQASPTGAASADAAMKAGKAIGWDMKLFDAKLDPTQFSNGIKQAVAVGADGVVLIAVDCPAAKSALQQAKDAGVETVGVYALDCDEVDASDSPLYSAQVSFGDRYDNLADAYQAWGASSARWAIERAGGKPKVLAFNNSEYNILIDYQKGFDAEIEACDACSLEVVDWLAADFGPNLTALTQAALLKNPDASIVQGGSNPTLGITQGVVQAGKQTSVSTIGGLGLSIDIDAIKEGQMTASNAWPTEWFGFAAIDTLNSVFNGTDVRDQGLGWQIVDADHNLPEGGFTSDVDYVAAYTSSWGVN